MGGVWTYAVAVTVAAGLLPAAPASTPPRSAATQLACLPLAPTPGPGIVDPFHVPLAAATQLNADAKLLYRQGRWNEARAKYRAAEAADPDFLAPVLNIACSFVRQERFAEAVTEVLRLLGLAYLPWSAEVISAADLGALKVRAEGKQLRAALDAGRLRWAEGLVDDVILLARLRAPLKLGTAEQGALVLGPRQEVFAWSPRTLRYRQLTSEEGRVLAVARSSDGRRISYATAEKLIRGPGTNVALRGVVVQELELGTLSPLDRGRVEGDLRRLDILPLRSGFAYRIDNGSLAATTYRLKNARFEPSLGPRTGGPAVSLTGHGVAAGTSKASGASLPDGCAGTVRDVRTSDGTAAVQVRANRRAPAIAIGGPFGASLSGLPIP